MDSTPTIPTWIREDLENAREMLDSLLPAKPDVPGLDCHGECIQLMSLGGDYYDFITRQDGNFVFAIGDVSGKGVSAAFMMSNLRYSLHSEMLRAKTDLIGVMNNLNKLVFESSPSNRFITFFYALYEPKSMRLRYVNAGHNPPYLFRRLFDDPQVLDGNGLPLGMISEAVAPYPKFNQNTVSLEPGDFIIAFTDGITEAINNREDEWGEQNLIAEIKKVRESSADQIVATVFEKVRKFCGRTPQRDDMTLVVIKAK